MNHQSASTLLLGLLLLLSAGINGNRHGIVKSPQHNHDLAANKDDSTSSIARLVTRSDALITAVSGIRPATSVTQPNGAGSALLYNADGSLDAFQGVARFISSASCTGAFIQTSQRPDAPAYIITNGHCIQNWHPHAVYQDEPIRENYRVVFNYFVDTRDAQIAFPVKTMTYSTMKQRDIAIVELAATVGELVEQGIQPFAIADTMPPPEAAISIIGAPVMGLAPEERHLRREACALNGQVNLLEAQWHFANVFRVTCQDIVGGSSGSPVFVAGSQAIFALINTGTVGSKFACALHAPCEVTDTGTEMLLNTSYATPVVGLAACFTAQGRFDLSALDCPLDDGRQPTLAGYPQTALQPLLTDSMGTAQRPTWNTTLSGNFTHYRYKTGPVSHINCQEDTGYSEAIALTQDPLITDTIPAAEGFYYLCVVAGSSPTVDATWQSTQHATIVVAQIDATPPTILPDVSIRDLGSEYAIEPIFEQPELADYSWKLGSPTTTNCSDPTAYQRYRRIPIRLDKSTELPSKLCLIGFDSAQNPTPPLEKMIQAE